MAVKSTVLALLSLNRQRPHLNGHADMSRDVEMASEINRDSPTSESSNEIVMDSGTPSSSSDDSTAAVKIRNLSEDTTIIPAETPSPGPSPTTTLPSPEIDSPSREMSFFSGAITIPIPRSLWPPPKAQPDERLTTMRMEKIEDYPEGYPRFAATIVSDTNFSVYRRFGTMRNRVLLYQQQRLARLEAELLQLDLEDKNSDDKSHQKRLKSLRIDEETNSTRLALIEKIDVTLRAYDELLQREKQSLAMTKPNKRNYMSILNWAWNYRQLLKSEIQFLQPMDDFVILADEQDSNFHVFLETLILKLPARMWKALFTTEAERTKSKTKGIKLVSKERVNIVVRTIVAALIVTLLIIPICILFNIDFGNSVRTLIICVFVVLFPVVLSIFARPKNHELIAATAAYAAVLVVFLGNLSNETKSGGTVSFSRP